MMRNGVQNPVILQITFQVLLAYKKEFVCESGELVPCVRVNRNTHAKERASYNIKSSITSCAGMNTYILRSGMTKRKQISHLSQKVPAEVLGAKHRNQTILQSGSLFLMMKQSHSIYIIH